jgi:hypothetical protein
MKYIGDYRVGDTIYLSFNTRDTDGAPITLAGTPAVRVYKDADDTEDDSGITLSVDDDSRTGWHRVTIDTSADATFYAAGADFQVVLTAGTVDSISVVGVCVGEFSIENRSALMPSTAGRKLGVEADGDLTKVNTLDGHTAQTGDAYAIVNSGTHGNAALKTLVDTVDDFLDTEMAAVLAAVDTEVAAILALLDDARGEPGQGAPPVNPDLATKVDWLYTAWRNLKNNDGTTTNLYADNGTTIIAKQTTSEAGGTVTKAEWITGA